MNEYVKTTFISRQTGRNGNICYAINCKNCIRYIINEPRYPEVD